MVLKALAVRGASEQRGEALLCAAARTPVMLCWRLVPVSRLLPVRVCSMLTTGGGPIAEGCADCSELWPDQLVGLWDRSRRMCQSTKASRGEDLKGCKQAAAVPLSRRWGCEEL